MYQTARLSSEVSPSPTEKLRNLYPRLDPTYRWFHMIIHGAVLVLINASIYHIRIGWVYTRGPLLRFSGPWLAEETGMHICRCQAPELPEQGVLPHCSTEGT